MLSIDINETVLRRKRLCNNDNDFSCGLELNDIIWKSLNENDRNIIYVNRNIESKTVPGELKKMRSCKCTLSKSINKKSCSPIWLSGLGRKYTSSNGESDTYPLHPNIRGTYVECNYNCPCSQFIRSRQNSAASTFFDCGRRQLQQGCKFAFEIVKMDDGRGYGVRARQNIGKGAFVTEYIGEIISMAENLARESVASSSSAFYTWDLDRKFVIDATTYRNIAAFINHRCKNANLVPAKVICFNQRPRIAFFAKHNIEKGEELTINYWTGMKRSGKTGFGSACRCLDCIKKRKMVHDANNNYDNKRVC